MNDFLDLDTLEERVFRARFDDGLLDLFLGIFVLGMGLTLGTEYGGMAAIWGAVLFPLWAPLRQKITEPRLGWIEPGPRRKASIRLRFGFMTLALSASALAGVVLWLLHAQQDTNLKESLRALGPTPFHAMLALMIAVGAAMLELKRGFVHAGLVLVLGVAGFLLGGDIGEGLVAAGVVITIWGAVLMRRFLRDHPVREVPEDG